MKNLPKNNVCLKDWNLINNDLNDSIQKDEINLNELLNYFNEVIKFNDFLESDQGFKSKIISLNDENEMCISGTFLFYNNYGWEQNFKKCKKIIEQMYLLIDHYIRNKVKPNDKLINDDLRLFLCLYLSFSLNSNIKDFEKKFEEIVNWIVNKNLCNYNQLFAEFVNLISRLGKKHFARLVSYVDLTKLIDIIWNNLKYDNSILSCIISNYPEYHNNEINVFDQSRYINTLIQYYIFPNMDEAKKLLRSEYPYKDNLTKIMKFTPKELILNCNNINDILSGIKKFKIPLDDEIKKQIMYSAAADSYKANQFKKLKQEYNLKYDDKCLEIYCNSTFIDTTGFIYLIEEGCNVKFHDFCKYLKKINGGSTMHKVINLVHSKSKKNNFCL